MKKKGIFNDVTFQGLPKKYSEYENKMRLAKYWAQIDLIDENIGRLLEALDETGQLNNTLIIFMSDHGDMAGDHGMKKKGCRFYEGLTRVPLVFWYPALFEENMQSEALVELVDIVPTILEIVGLPVSEKIQGETLLPILTATSENLNFHKNYVRCEFYDTLEPDTKFKYNYATMLRTNRFKLAVYHGHEKGELFDLKNDPNEFNNLWDDIKYQEVRFDLLKKCFDHTVFSIDTGPERTGRY